MIFSSSAPSGGPGDPSNLVRRCRAARQRAIAAENRLLEITGPPARNPVSLSEVAHVQRLHLEVTRLLCVAVEESTDMAAAVQLLTQVLADHPEDRPLL